MPCAVLDCPRPVLARGWCTLHWKRWRKYGDPTVSHRATKQICAIPDCGRFCFGQGWCAMHYQRWWKHGDPLRILRRGNGHAAGVRYAGDAHHGYVYIGDGHGGLIAEHRLVWEQHHGPIPPDFQVHHRNEDRADNRIENLELLHIVAHTRHHAQARDPVTGRWMSVV